MLGRKRFFLICLALFTVSSVLCGLAWNFQCCCYSASCRAWAAVAWCRSRNRSWRTPPPEKRGQAFAMFGRGGGGGAGGRADPGGYLADNRRGSGAS